MKVTTEEALHQEQAELFGRMIRESFTTTAEGMSLGPSSSRTIIEADGGTLWGYTERRQRSDNTVYLATSAAEVNEMSCHTIG